MIDRTALLRDLQREQTALEDDLRARLDELPDLSSDLRAEHKQALQRGRTAASYVQWCDEQLTQAAAAWVLGCVFVRFCEDNGLVEPVWLAGPGERRLEAADAHAAFFARHPDRNDRDWLLDAFSYLRDQPVTAGLLDAHNPVWRFPISADAAERLVRFWRRQGEHSGLVHDFADGPVDTRFLGDLYQDLSETARKRYALLQTPDFVADFILDRTLDRAIEDRGLDGLKLIDPTCGSGHFLLDAFARLLDARLRTYPGEDVRERVQAALDVLHGVDVNPYAVAIARFRLTVAALRASAVTRLERAPDFRLHLAAGDSLLHGERQLEFGEEEAYDADALLSGFTYATEDLDALRAILRPGQYDVVVGNPPYVTVKDKALNAAYRRRYETCSGKYALSVPFCERFFQLAKPGDRAGWVGQITSNSFMKREFGTKLIEQFLAQQDLMCVVDSEGAWIPGHNMDGTPTVILVGRHRPPVGTTVRAVLGKGKRETRAYGDEGKGPYWGGIVDHVNEPGWDDDWISVTDLPRTSLAEHPWSLSGGGASDVMLVLDRHPSRLHSAIDGRIGFASFPGLDEAFLMPPHIARRLEDGLTRPVVLGDIVRDWRLATDERALAPYDERQRPLPLAEQARWGRRLWPLRSAAEGVVGFGQETRKEGGSQWWTWYRWVAQRYRTPLSIAFAEVAAHNHFVLDRGGKVFKQTAPVIKLPDGASEDEHLRLLGLLNSSTACFWLKERCKPKGGAAEHLWARTYQFNGSNVAQFPLPKAAPLEQARRLHRLAQEAAANTPGAVAQRAVPTRAALGAAGHVWLGIRAEMVAVQEELDWAVYRLYGLLDDDLTYPGHDLPRLALGERAFEIVLARKVAAGDEQTAWFTRHGSTPITEVPAHWPPAYRGLVERRIALIEERSDLALIERPECKRRWAVTPWAEQEGSALRGWLLDRLEEPALWRDGQGRPQPLSVAQLADRLAGDKNFADVLGLLVGSPDFSLVAQLTALVKNEAVPHAAAARYTDTGLRKRAQWEDTWALQRQEDAGEDVVAIPMPPKYEKKDFARGSYWDARGKLDVPKERFVLFTGAERDTDSTSVLGWAGWDHLKQALALAALVGDRAGREGWAAARLKPLLAGVAEREPWLHQWHAAPDPAYGGSPAAFVTTWLDRQLGVAGLTRADLATWRPARATRGRARKVPA